MTAISDGSLLQIIQYNADFIKPFNATKVKEGISHGLSPATYDLSLSRWGMLRYKESSVPLSAKRVTMDDVVRLQFDEKEGAFLIPPMTCALGVANERVHIPNDVVGLVMDKSTYARTFLYFLNTLFDPGFPGYPTIECCNGLHRPQFIYPDEGIVQMLFLYLDAPALKPYDGKYSDQPPMVVLPKAL